MHCIHCGVQIPDTAKFCIACGRPVQAAPATPDREPIVEETPVAEPTATPEEGSAQEPVEETTPAYTPPVNASEGYKAANAQLPSSYSNPNYSSQGKATYTAPVPPASNGLAIAGMIISAVRIVLILIALIAFIALLIRGAGQVGHEFINNWPNLNPYNF